MRDRDLIYRIQEGWNAKTVRITKAGGQTNRNFIVEHKKKKFFVRLPWESDVINRTIEGKNILALSKNKKLTSILPKYHLYIVQKKNILALTKSKDVFDVPDGTMITEYIEGKEFTYRLFQKQKYQEALARTMHTFHTSGVKFCNTYDVFVDEIEKYRIAAQQYPLSEIANKKTLLNFGKIEKEAKKKLLSLKSSISTHNDFLFQNFLIRKNGNIYLLDFEYAGLNKRGGIYYDFGFLFADNLFRDPPMSKKIFEGFLDTADRIYGKKLDRQQVYAGALAATVMQFWWGILRCFDCKTQKERQYFLAYINKRVEGLQKIM